MSETNNTTAAQMPEPSSPPRLFVSYSWSSPEHEQWVLDLATRLTSNGVNVVLDKWDLREGHDAYAFMERMVTDLSVTKVAMVSDRVYAQKADERTGGVGTETQLIAREVYGAPDQTKFVTILAERGPDGQPFLPTYYKTRVYIDLSDPSTSTKEYERLLRWIFDKPQHVRPELGEPPTFLTDSDRGQLGTEALFAHPAPVKQPQSSVMPPTVRIGKAGKVRINDNYLPGQATIYESDETGDFEALRNRLDR